MIYAVYVKTVRRTITEQHYYQTSMGDNKHYVERTAPTKVVQVGAEKVEVIHILQRTQDIMAPMLETMLGLNPGDVALWEPQPTPPKEVHGE